MNADYRKNPKLLRRHLVMLAFILVAAGFLRFARIGAPSLWKDEIWSIEIATGRGSLHDQLPLNTIRQDQADLTSLQGEPHWWAICAHLGGVTHPPLYFLALRWWMDLFGNGAASVRSLSAILSLAIIPVFFDLCRLLHGPRIALFAAAVMAFAIAQIDFAQDARSYSLLLFLDLCIVDQVLRIEYLGATRRRLILLIVFLTAAALTHYLCVGALLALAIYAAVRLRGRARTLTAAAFAIAAILILIVWIPLFIEQKHTLPSLAPTFLREARISEHIKLTFFRIIGLPIEFLLGESRGEAVSSGVVLTIFLFTVGLPLIRLPFRRDLLFWVLWGLGTIGFVAAMDLTRQTTLVGYLRYTILASPAVYAAIAAFDWPRRPFIRDAVAISTIAILAILAIQRAIDGVPPQEDWQTLARDLDISAGPDDLLVFYNDDPWTSPGTWYMGFKYYTPDSRRPWLILNAPANPDVLRDLQSHKLLWLIGRYPQIQGPRLLPGWIPAAAEEQTTAGAFCLMVPAYIRSTR